MAQRAHKVPILNVKSEVDMTEDQHFEIQKANLRLEVLRLVVGGERLIQIQIGSGAQQGGFSTESVDSDKLISVVAPIVDFVLNGTKSNVTNDDFGS